MSNLTQRLITGTIFVIVLVGCIWWSAWSMFALFLVITVLGLNEFYTLAKKANAEPLRGYSIFGGSLIVISAFLAKSGLFHAAHYLLIPVIFLIFFIELFRKKENPMNNIGWSLLGMIYVAVPMMMLVSTFTPRLFMIGYLSDEFTGAPYDFRGPLMIFVLIWISDSMAYVCGRLFGRHKLWERISPKKTWEGFIGGLIFTMIVGGMVGNWVFGACCHWKHEISWLIISFVISVAGMLGDLVESLFKRSIDVKDSGTILPGHGGILDRFDALFLAVPFAMTAWWMCEALLPVRLP